MFDGLFETHINVSDLARSMEFYGATLGMELGRLEESRRVVFYFIGGWNRTMLGVWEKPQAEVTEQHLAFEVATDDLEARAQALRDRGIATLDFFGQESDQPTVFGWMPTASYYFKDPDGHLLEIIARLPGDPLPDKPVMTWDEWRAASKQNAS